MGPAERHLTPGIDQLDDALATGEPEALRRALRELTSEDRELLSQQIGRDAVQRSVRSARRGVRATPRGRVIALHGIMGAELEVARPGGDVDLLWVHVPRLMIGAVAELRLDAQGATRPGVRVKGIRREYAPLVAALAEAWDVRPFAYDWRADIDASADALARQVQAFGQGGPVHLVAHSMGGVVARRMIQRHPALWASMDDAANGHRRGGRLVMLGTPNRGALAVPPIFTGTESMVWWLEKLDFRHDMEELLEILVTFVGGYQMLPTPKTPRDDDRAKLFARASWGASPVVQRWLDKGSAFQTALFDVDTPERLLYVAGYDEPTPYRIRIESPGQFAYKETHEGDGRVPHELGLLPGVETFFVREKHGALPANDAVLSAIHGLLETGKTDELATSIGAPRRGAHEGQWLPASHFFPSADAEAARLLGTASRRGAATRVDVEAQLRLESHALDGWVGSADAERGPAAPAVRAPAASVRRGPRPRLDMRVMWGDVRKIDADVMAVGHYAGVLPQYAEAALDEVVSPPGAAYDERVLVKLSRRGAIAGELGEVTLVPRVDRARGLVAVVGMGPPGTFGPASMRRLTRQLVWTVASLPAIRSLGMLLIGSGKGNLDTRSAVDALVSGLVEAFAELAEGLTIERLSIVDNDRAKCEEIRAALAQAATRHRGDAAVDLVLASELTIHTDAKVAPQSALPLALAHAALAAKSGKRSPLVELVPADHGAKQAVREALDELREAGRSAQAIANQITVGRRGDGEASSQPTRLCFTRDGADLRVAALTHTAVKPERVLSFDRALLDELVEQMVDPDPAERPRLSRLLTRLVVPRDFGPLLQECPAFVFELDRETAPVHWEMLAPSLDETGDAAIALLVEVARQLRTPYSPAPMHDARAGERLRALVIGDPGDPREGDDLAGARREAIAVWELLASHPDVEVTAMIGAPSSPRGSRPRGARAAGRLEVLAELLEGGYDIVHYAGHGDFDPVDGSRVGWVFEGGELTSRELELVTRPPRLIVANACLSGLLSRVRGSGRAARREATLLPGLADEFFRRGVRDYVGTAWEVNDEGAVEFARVFYGALLGDGANPPATIGAAMLRARQALARKQNLYDALWAAYQHYGDPTATIGARPSAPTRKRAAKKKPRPRRKKA